MNTTSGYVQASFAYHDNAAHTALQCTQKRTCHLAFCMAFSRRSGRRLGLGLMCNIFRDGIFQASHLSDFSLQAAMGPDGGWKRCWLVWTGHQRRDSGTTWVRQLGKRCDVCWSINHPLGRDIDFM
ncbi:uncharacterized protein MYCFIDRAFT_209760 [Pseudocercospora fijiensis CIRAD86]|uniref:Uncharacterized protein n=1 Tax=Pseudocercospora fijiensis (strain CIRAD86) TaxID=383855 RepID=N1Q919_PSEFD|nr:uncharacterized protein MYCFIDRAFT_209760 [Pseudocercospora fijiensis CIRAD86]EME88276.1 hypothetical protein MYCFIDRAFT_209760 [Pseudocercospora fijiensis CIRAD86]